MSGYVKGNALSLERVKTISIGKNTTLMLLGDIFGIELTVVDKKVHKSIRVQLPRKQVIELVSYMEEVLEATKEEKEEVQQEIFKN